MVAVAYTRGDLSDMETLCSFENWSLRRVGIREVVATGGSAIYNFTLNKFDLTNNVNCTDSLIEENVERSFRTAEIIDIAYKSTLNHMVILKLPSGEARF